MINISISTKKALLILGVVILAVGIAILIRLVFFKPLPVEAPSEEPEIDIQSDLPEEALDNQDILQEDQLEQSAIQN